jgi:glutamate 5-kinase
MKPTQERIHIRKALFDRVKRTVIKVGTGVLTHDQDLSMKVISRLAREISWLMDQEREVILVSSGAIGSGMKRMGLTQRPTDIPCKQAAAAVGQPRLMLAYEKAFGRHDKKVAQVLLTRDDLWWSWRS